MLGTKIMFTGLVLLALFLVARGGCEPTWSGSLDQWVVLAGVILSALTMVVGALIAIWSAP